MRDRACMTPEEAFQAGFDAPCDHGLANPDGCPSCQLTDAEIGRLVALLRGSTGLRAQISTAA